MKTRGILPRLFAGLWLSTGLTFPLRAEIEVWLSAKIILNSDGSRPGNAAGSVSISAEVKDGNAALSLAAREFNPRVVEQLDIQPAAPSGQPAGYWFNLDARTNRAVFEAAALADPATWRWHTGVINEQVHHRDSAGRESVLSVVQALNLFKL